MTLVSLVLSPEAAYCCKALLLRSPTPPGKALYLKIAPSTMARMWLFPLQKGISASSTSVRTVPCCGGSFYPVFSSLSGVIVPRAVENWLCLWQEVSSESSYADIFPAIFETQFLSGTKFINNNKCTKQDQWHMQYLWVPDLVRHSFLSLPFYSGMLFVLECGALTCVVQVSTEKA